VTISTQRHLRNEAVRRKYCRKASRWLAKKKIDLINSMTSKNRFEEYFVNSHSVIASKRRISQMTLALLAIVIRKLEPDFDSVQSMQKLTIRFEFACHKDQSPT
jgi:hypothetical protein